MIQCPSVTSLHMQTVARMGSPSMAGMRSRRQRRTAATSAVVGCWSVSLSGRISLPREGG